MRFLHAVATFALIAGCGASALAPRPDTLSGRVTDAAGPVCGAVVRVKGTMQSAITAADGTFILSCLRPGAAVAVTACASGYYIAGGVPVLPGGPPLVISLKKHATEDNAAYDWLPSRRHTGAGENQGCAECHSRQGTALPFNLPVDEWELDLHSHQRRSIPAS